MVTACPLACSPYWFLNELLLELLDDFLKLLLEKELLELLKSLEFLDEEDGVVVETASCILVKSESSRVLRLLKPVSNVVGLTAEVLSDALMDVLSRSSECKGTHTHEALVRLLNYRGLVILGHVSVSRVTVPPETLNVAVHITHWFYNATLSMFWLAKLSKLARQCPNLVIRLLQCRFLLASIQCPLHVVVKV